MNWAGKTYWVVGASEGLGRALALALSSNGVRVVASARNEGRLEALCNEANSEVIALPVDVTDGDSIKGAVAKLPSLDGIVYVAGSYEPMSALDWDADASALMCDVNLIGAMRVFGSVLPEMLKQGRGHLVVIGSLAGHRGLPNAIGYGASKAGIMHLAENLRADLPQETFRVQTINPGFIETRLTDKNAFKMPFIMTPEDAADRTLRAMARDRFETNFPMRFAMLFKLARLLPNWLYFRLFARR